MSGTSFTIPSIFTAIDKLTAPIRKMQAGLQNFATAADNGIARSERMFRKLTPVLNETQKQMLSFASSAAIAGSVIGGIVFSVDSIKKYDDALASFKTIVGDTNGSFAEFQKEAINVAKATKSSSVDVVKSFESIAGLNADLAKTPKILAEVTKSAILLSQGSGDDLQKSAENLVGILNQFNMKGDEASRVINVLAAGQAVGASSITKTADAFTVFGAVAKSANISVEQATGLVQVLGSKMVLGAEAGTALRATIGLLQKSGFGYKKGLFDVNEALATAKEKYDKLRTAKEKDNFISKTFGEVNKSTGTILVNNIKAFKDFTAGVTNTSEAQKAADIKTQTLSASLDQLKNAWVTMITGSDATSSSLTTVKEAIGYVTSHLDQIVSVGINVIKFFAAWKAIMIVSKIALAAYNIVLGISSGLQSTASIAVGRSSIALGAYNITQGVVTASTWLWNAALSANPIGLIIIGVAALTAGIVALIYQWDAINKRIAKQDQNSFEGEITQVAKLQKKYEALGMSKEAASKKAIQTENARLGGQRAGIQKQIETEKAKGAFGIDQEKLKSLITQEREIRMKQGAISDPVKTAELTSLVDKKEALSTKVAQGEAVNNQTTQTNNSEVLIKVDAPEGTSAKTNSKNVSIVPKVGSTMPKR